MGLLDKVDTSKGWGYYGIFAILPVDLEHFEVVAGIIGLISPSLGGKVPFVSSSRVKNREDALKMLSIGLVFSIDDVLLTLTTGVGGLVPFVGVDKENLKLAIKALRRFGIISGDGKGDPQLSLGGGATYNPSNPRSTGDGFPIGKYAFGAGKIIGIIAVIAIGLFAVTGVVGGSGYGDLVADELGYQAAGVNLPAIGTTLAQAGKTAECLGDAACLRQWQFNNTQRPGSEAVGQEYSLEIEDFEVNDGFPLDVANRRPEDRVPATFSVYNPRNGLKGIEARNVAYRIGVYGNSLGGGPVCQTDWMSLGGEYANNQNNDANGTILPGGFATPLGTHGELNLENCGLLQPALGIKRRVKLQVAYDYSSQSTLQVQAMSRENMRSLEKRPSFKKSQTADTPVKTYVNVESPITYRVNENGKAESSIFGVRVGFETGQKDVKYRVNVDDFKLYDSSKTVDVERAFDQDVSSARCEDLEIKTRDVSEDEDRSGHSDSPIQAQKNTYTFSENMRDYLDRRQEDSWFKSGSGPSPARCAMVLDEDEVGSISPTGETLTFRIDANYTVMLEKKVEGFEAINSHCDGGSYNCPMLVPDSESSPKLISKCESSLRIDANNGCDVRSAKDWTAVSKINNYDTKIEEGETAYLWSRIKRELPDTGIFNTELLDSEGSESAIGLREEKLVDIIRGKPGALVAEGSEEQGDISYKSIRQTFCEDNLLKSRREWVEEEGYTGAIYFNPATTNCGETEGDSSESSSYVGDCEPGEYYKNGQCHESRVVN